MKDMKFVEKKPGLLVVLIVIAIISAPNRSVPAVFQQETTEPIESAAALHRLELERRCIYFAKAASVASQIGAAVFRSNRAFCHTRGCREAFMTTLPCGAPSARAGLARVGQRLLR